MTTGKPNQKHATLHSPPRPALRVEHIYYNADDFKARPIQSPSEIIPLSDHVNLFLIRGVEEGNAPEVVGEKIGLHPLVVEDIRHTDARNKLEEYPGYLLLIVRVPVGEIDEVVETEQISFVLQDESVYVFTESDLPDWEQLLTRLSLGSRLRGLNADDLLAALLDDIVDRFFDVFDGLANRLDVLEENIMTDPSSKDLDQLHHIKRSLIGLRGVLWPLRESLSRLSRNYIERVTGETLYYVRDVEDHVVQLIQLGETYQEIGTSLVDLYLSAIGNRTNEIMKVLTIFSTIFIPTTFLSSVYGMNFQHMPELKQTWAYPLFWVFCAIILVVMLRYFRKKDWI